MKNNLCGLIVALTLGFSSSHLHAGDGPVVVELFTSQGCSSCPPADKVLHDLAKRDDVIALALHVDYWDYIGWKDEFAKPAFGIRQKAYARLASRRVVYTPQMIIGGDANIEGAKNGRILNAISKMRSNLVDVGLSLRKRAGRLTISASKTKLDGPVDVHLVRFSPQEKVKILRGENRGRTLRYSNVVRSWETLRSWDGKTNLKFSTDVEGDDHIAVVFQYPGPGHVIAATKVN